MKEHNNDDSYKYLSAQYVPGTVLSESSHWILRQPYEVCILNMFILQMSRQRIR